MRILLLSYYYPPVQEVGGVRPSRLAEALRLDGHEVVVITAATIEEEPGIRHYCDRLTVRTIRPRPLLWQMAQDLDLGSLKIFQAPKQAAGRTSLRAKLRRYVKSILWLPDAKRGFLLPALIEGLAVARERRVDLVYATAPPFSVHVAGSLLSRLIAAPSVIEYRDPWTISNKQPSARSQLSDVIESRLRHSSIRHARLVVTATQGIADAIQREWPPRSVVVAMNGIEPLVSAPPPPEAKAFTILHAGELYLGRDPSPFFRAVAELRAPLSLTADRLIIEFLGHGRRYRDRSVEQMATELGIRDLVRFSDPVPFDIARRRMQEADALLLLAMEQPLQLPNKLFDYLAARRPILAYADRDGETSRLLSGLAGHTVIADPLAEGAMHAIGDLLRAGRQADLTSPTTIAPDLAWSAQYRRLVQCLEHTLTRARQPVTSRFRPLP